MINYVGLREKVKHIIFTGKVLGYVITLMGLKWCGAEEQMEAFLFFRNFEASWLSKRCFTSLLILVNHPMMSNWN